MSRIKTKFVCGVVMTWLVAFISFSASANSVSLTQDDFDPVTGQITFTIVYDFTDFAMFGGGVDVVYDTEALVFVSYTQAPLAADAQAPASPIGELVEPGLYSGAGIGTFEFFNGMTSAGEIGTFVFDAIGPFDSGNVFCGFVICLAPNAINPFVSLAGEDVTAELLGLPVPVPAGMWLMLGALGVFYTRRTHHSGI